MSENENYVSQMRMKYCLCICLVLLTFCLSAQVQPLSRNDNANIEESQHLYNKALETENWKEASRHLNDIAFIYWEHNDYHRAIEYYENSLELNERLNNENGIAMIQNNLGMLYSDIGEYEKSMTYFKSTLAARTAFKNREGIIAALRNISVVQNNLGMYQESIEMLQEALNKARETNDPDQISSCYLMLSETYEKIGDVINTKKYYKLYQTFYSMKYDKDLLRLKQVADEESLLKQIAEIQAKKQEIELNKLKDQLTDATEDLNQFDADKVRLSDALTKTELQIQYLETEKEIERLKNEDEMRRALALRNLLILGSLSLVIISFFIYRSYLQEQKSKKNLALKNDQINAQNKELDDLNKIIARHNDRMQTELNVGKEIQMSMLPSHFPDVDGVDLYATLEPAREVGGDLYDFFKIDKDQLIFGIGDVSDKGVPAALFMAVTKTLVKTNASYSSNPGNILTQVNRELNSDNDASMFVSYFLCLLNIRTGHLSYCNAGHNPPLYRSKKGDLSKLQTLHGPVLGAVEDYEYNQNSIEMKEGDQLILYTDGVVEAMNVNQSLYSLNRLETIISREAIGNSKKSIETIINDVAEFRGAADQSDDITVLSIIFNGYHGLRVKQL